MSSREIHFKHNHIGRLKAKGRKKIYEYHANINPKKAGMGIIISDKVELRAKKITKGSGDHYIMMKG